MIRIRPDRSRMLAVYLYYYLTNRAVRENRVRRYVTISTISGINQDNLCRIEVVVPPLTLQQQFAALVERFEQLRAIQRESGLPHDANPYRCSERSCSHCSQPSGASCCSGRRRTLLRSSRRRPWRIPGDDAPFPVACPSIFTLNGGSVKTAAARRLPIRFR